MSKSWLEFVIGLSIDFASPSENGSQTLAKPTIRTLIPQHCFVLDRCLEFLRAQSKTTRVKLKHHQDLCLLLIRAVSRIVRLAVGR